MAAPGSVALPLVPSASHTEYNSGFSRFTVFTFNCAYGGFQWNIHKRFNEVDDLHEDLGKWYKRQGADFRLPEPRSQFFGRFDPEFLRQREAELLGLLRAVAMEPRSWACPAVRAFFEVSPLSFSRALGRKGKEGWIRKQSGGRKVMSNGIAPWDTWKRRWFVLKGEPPSPPLFLSHSLMYRVAHWRGVGRCGCEGVIPGLVFEVGAHSGCGCVCVFACPHESCCCRAF